MGVTALLFLLMLALISQEPMPQVVGLDTYSIDFVPEPEADPPPVVDDVPPTIEESPQDELAPPDYALAVPNLAVTERPVPNVGTIPLERPTVSARIDIGPTAGAPLRNNDVIPVFEIPPQVPREARLRGISGWVDLEFTVRTDGSVGDVRVLRSQPPRLFDQAARDAIVRWKFWPRTVDGEPRESRALKRFEFLITETQ